MLLQNASRSRVYSWTLSEKRLRTKLAEWYTCSKENCILTTKGLSLVSLRSSWSRVAAGVAGKSEKAVEADYKKTGDIGLTIEKVVEKRSQTTLTKRPLTVRLVYDTFDKIAHSEGSGSVETKLRLLTSLLNDASPKEAKYIARLAVGRLRLGVADMTVLDALAIAYGGDKLAREPLERAYNLSSDLGHVAEVVARDGLEGAKKLKITVGRPIRAMLCERLPDRGIDIAKAWRGGRC